MDNPTTTARADALCHTQQLPVNNLSRIKNRAALLGFVGNLTRVHPAGFVLDLARGWRIGFVCDMARV